MKISYQCILVGLVIHATTVQTSATEVVRVENGKALILSFASDIRTVIVGNPELIQVTVVDDKTVVLNGIALGVTNLVTLTKDGRTKADYQIVVDENIEYAATIYRGINTERLNCTPNCRPI